MDCKWITSGAGNYQLNRKKNLFRQKKSWEKDELRGRNCRRKQCIFLTGNQVAVFHAGHKENVCSRRDTKNRIFFSKTFRDHQIPRNSKLLWCSEQVAVNSCQDLSSILCHNFIARIWVRYVQRTDYTNCMNSQLQFTFGWSFESTVPWRTSAVRSAKRGLRQLLNVMILNFVTVTYRYGINLTANVSGSIFANIVAVIHPLCHLPLRCPLH